MIRVLELATRSRKEILTKLGLANNANDFETYIQPLVAINWAKMTIPDKPTSPKQQYLTTIKGRVILEILKYRQTKIPQLTSNSCSSV